MKSKTIELIVQMFAFGLILAGIKLVYSFFPFFNLLDLIIFLLAGYLFGAKFPLRQRNLGLFLALPAFAMSLFFVMQNGLSSISAGIGTAHLISLAVIPVATVMGILIKKKRQIPQDDKTKFPL
jgi:hypothetical protein